MIFGKDMLKLLDALPEAYMIFKEGRLEYANQAARPYVGGKQNMAEVLGLGLQEMAEQTIEDFSLDGVAGSLRIAPLRLEADWVSLVCFRARSYKEEVSVKGLLSTVGRELRDTMAVVAAALDLLLPQLETEDSRVQSYLAMLCQNQRRVQRMAGNLGSFCALVDGGIDLNRQKFDLVDLCATLIDQVAGLWTNRARTIRFQCGLNSLYILGDEERIRRMLLGILGNSIKHTAEDGSILLELAHVPEQERVLICISDNGEGMTEEALAHVFRSFEDRAGLCNKESGLGLGLPIAYGIARLHGGALVVESKEGRGTRVTVTLNKGADTELALHETVEPYGPTAQRVLLTELSDALEREEYLPRMLD